MAAGYTGREMKAILQELDYRRFKDPSLLERVPVMGPLASLILEKGLYEGDFLEKWLEDLLGQKGVSTFGDLILPEYRDEPRYRFKLRVITSDITRGCLLVLPQDIAEYGIPAEELGVARAVRMSMSIPFFYKPVKLQNRRTGTASYLVDGGLLSNFPVWLFDTEGAAPEWPTFGFKLVEPGEGKPHRVRGPISLLSALFATMLEAHDRRHIKEQHFVRTIAIPTLGIGTTEFDIPRERSEALYQSGRAAAERFLTTWDFAGYIAKYRQPASPA
ncbi:MAG: patatin-like phospholipase family protein [Chloroflexota bacterium]